MRFNPAQSEAKLAPLDREGILESVSKARRLIVAEPGWHSFGAAAEIVATATESLGDRLLHNPIRIAYPDSHTPMSMALEEKYYPGEPDLVAAVKRAVSE
jgi:pyruvate/2-oxoglutarate/acetoin dehydrogenase E1 component